MKGLTLFQSNRLEALADRLAEELSENRRAGFSFRPDTVLVNNYALAALDLAGRQFLARFHELDFSSGEDLSEKPRGNSMLSAVQDSVSQMKELEKVIPGQGKGAYFSDGSIEFHSCHNRLREVEVFHDRLVNAFMDDSSLEPHQVAIMAPDTGGHRITSGAQYVQ